MLVLTRGEAGIDCCDPFVGALLKRNSVCKYGPHIIICDLLVFTLRDGTLLSCYLFPSHLLYKSLLCAYAKEVL